MTTADDARHHRVRLLEMTERLIMENSQLVPAGRVTATVACCRSELYRFGVRDEELVAATEAMARSRIAAWEPAGYTART